MGFAVNHLGSLESIGGNTLRAIPLEGDRSFIPSDSVTTTASDSSMPLLCSSIGSFTCDRSHLDTDLNIMDLDNHVRAEQSLNQPVSASTTSSSSFRPSPAPPIGTFSPAPSIGMPSPAPSISTLTKENLGSCSDSNLHLNDLDVAASHASISSKISCTDFIQVRPKHFRPIEQFEVLIRSNKSTSEDEEDEVESDGSEYTQSKKHSKKRKKEGAELCGCSVDVSKKWKETIETKTQMPTSMAVSYFEEAWLFSGPCHRHWRLLARILGLRNNLKATALIEALQLVYQGRHNLWELKTQPNTYGLFRKACQPQREIDSLGTYLFSHTGPPSKPNIDKLYTSFSVAEQQEWETTGCLLIKGLFSWWWDYKIPGFPECSIAEVVAHEYAMYKHHFQKVNQLDNYGWSRAMFYSLGQQVMRQDLAYYRAYVALWPDHQ